MSATLCMICERPVEGFRADWCRACGRSYDREAHKDGSVMGAVEWAAKRARWFAKRSKYRRAPEREGGAR